MIFVTVGSQMPFDRLIRTVDDWACRRRTTRLFAQIAGGDYVPRHMQWQRFISPAEYRRRIFESELIIAHAGMGTVLTALEFSRPLLVMPRRGGFGETRNDHQVATAARLAEAGYASVAMNEDELIGQLASLDQVAASSAIASHASVELLSAVRDFISGDAQPSRDSGVQSHPFPAVGEELAHAKAA